MIPCAPLAERTTGDVGCCAQSENSGLVQRSGTIGSFPEAFGTDSLTRLEPTQLMLGQSSRRGRTLICLSSNVTRGTPRVGINLVADEPDFESGTSAIAVALETGCGGA